MICVLLLYIYSFFFFIHFFFFFKQKTAYEIYQCDWSSDVCSSDLGVFFLALLVTNIASIVGKFGVDTALLRFVASAASDNDWRQVKGLYRAGLKIVVVTSLLSSLVIVVDRKSVV